MAQFFRKEKDDQKGKRKKRKVKRDAVPLRFLLRRNFRKNAVFLRFLGFSRLMPTLLSKNLLNGLKRLKTLSSVFQGILIIKSQKTKTYYYSDLQSFMTAGHKITTFTKHHKIASL